MSEDIVPNSAPQTQAATPDDTSLVWRAWLEVYRNPEKYPVKVRHKQDGRVDVTIPLPVPVDGAWHSIEQKWTCTPAELDALFETIPLHDSALVWQYLAAVRKVSPPRSPKRKTSRTLAKRLAAMDAQRLEPLITALYEQQVYWSRRFRRMVELVTENLGQTPTALHLTAWLIEHQPHHTWKGLERNMKTWTLKRPTAYEDVLQFRQEYLYHRPQLRRPKPETPKDLMAGAREVEGFLKKVPHF